MRRLLALLLLIAPFAHAVEIHIQFAALERMLGEQLFTQDGRKYVRGSAAAKCNFAYLEKPRFQGTDGKLRIRARFTGRSALNMFGQCVGLGDAFTAAITAVPQYKDRQYRPWERCRGKRRSHRLLRAARVRGAVVESHSRFSLPYRRGG